MILIILYIVIGFILRFPISVCLALEPTTRPRGSMFNNALQSARKTTRADKTLIVLIWPALILFIVLMSLVDIFLMSFGRTMKQRHAMKKFFGQIEKFFGRIGNVIGRIVP